MGNFSKIMKVIRVKILNKPGSFGKLADMIGENKGSMGDIKVVRSGTKYITRDITVYTGTPLEFEHIKQELEKIEEIKLIKVFDEIYQAHEGGLLEVKSKVKINSISDYEKYYIPGIAKIARTINRNNNKIYEYTNIGNVAGIVSNGSALLNFGENCIASSTYSYLESICSVVNEMSGVYASPLVVNTNNVESFVETVKNVYKSYGMIVLEDISSPNSIYIENSLQDLERPVIDTNKFGNAIVTLAGLINIAKETCVILKNSRIGLIGYGSKAYGIKKLLRAYGIDEIMAYDIKEEAVKRMEEDNVKVADSIADLMENSDIIIGASRMKDIIKFGMVKTEHIILSLSREPEIEPGIALKAGAKYAGDKKLINPMLAVPGLIKGTLEARASKVTLGMMVEAANVLAAEAHDEFVLPTIFDEGIHTKVAEAVKQAAIDEGVANLLEVEMEEDNRGKEADIFDNIRSINEWMSN